MMKKVLESFNFDLKSIRSGLFICIFLLLATQIEARSEKTTTADSISQTKMYPAPLLHLDSYFTHHILVAEKSTHTLYVFRNNDSYPELIKSYVMATGKKPGDKLREGDYRTPEGVFFFTEFLPHENLVRSFGQEGEIYGVGAFVMNYPNPVDVQRRKTGSGIWLHSTNDETRIDKGLDSRGCIVTANKHLINISKYIELERTMIVVVQDLHWISEPAWYSNRTALLTMIEDWRDSWEQEDMRRYRSHYSEDKFTDRIRGRLPEFMAHKRAVFSNPGKPTVNLSEISILVANDYAKVNFKQDYASRILQNIGRKTLYLKQDDFYRWQIVSENWTQRGIDLDKDKSSAPVAFEPSLRFFNTTRPEKIMNLTNHTASSQDTN